MSNAGELFSPGPRAPIRLRTVLVVEGRDMFGFFLALLRELALDSQIEVRNGGGVPQLYDYLAVLPNIAGFDAVISLGVVCDTEADPARAFTGLCNALGRASLAIPAAALQATTPPPPPRVTVALLPDASTPGMLETVCWRALASDVRLPCVEEFLKCIATQTGQPVARVEKSRVYAYIASREEPWFLLGQAAQAGYFPWASPAFDEVKRFLQGLISTTPGP
jgi:hypothetical protein